MVSDRKGDPDRPWLTPLRIYRFGSIFVKGCSVHRYYPSPGSQFHAFYWGCFTVSTTTLPKSATIVFGPTSRFFDFSSLYYLLAYFSGWEADAGHSQPMMLFMVYIGELFLRWLMAAAVAGASMTSSPQARTVSAEYGASCW